MTSPSGGPHDGQGMATIPQVRFRAVDGVRIRYADSGGSEALTVLLTSP